jgi:scyllo-inosamine 4-kinase
MSAQTAEVPSDRYRDPATLAKLARIAAGIFARQGVDFATARRAGGWSNATWLAGGLALRIAVEPGAGDLLREAQLAPLLPSEAGYPPLVASGVAEGYEWMLAQEVRGQNLEELWPTLGWEARGDALRQLWAKAHAVHGVDVAAAAPYVRDRSPFYASSAEEAAARLARLEAARILTPHQVTVLRAALGRFWAALPLTPHVLNHGDLSIVNALWHDGQVVALLDFEFALVAPVELDLNELIKAAYAPPEAPDPLPDPDGDGLRRMQATVAAIARAALGTPGAGERLLGYAILLELWSLENWLAKSDGREPYADWQPYRTLTGLAGGDGGYLAPVLAHRAG